MLRPEGLTLCKGLDRQRQLVILALSMWQLILLCNKFKSYRQPSFFFKDMSVHTWYCMSTKPCVPVGLKTLVVDLSD